MRIFRNYSKSATSLGDLYILSAVRTPTGLINGVLRDFTAPQLGSFAIREALQRAAVPPADVENVFLETLSPDDCHNEIIKRTGLQKTASLFVSKTSSLSKAVKFLCKSNGKTCIAGGMQSSTTGVNFIKTAQEDAKKHMKSNLVSAEELRKYAKQDYDNFIKAHKNGAFLEEIIKVDFRKKGQQIVVGEDEILRENDITEVESFKPCDGAAAVIMSTEDYSKCNGLVPLAKVVSYAEELVNAGDLPSAQLLAIEKAIKAAECRCEDVARWEMVSVIEDIIISTANSLNISSSQVNKDGGGFGYSSGMSGVRALCHLVHSLSPGELGCAASSNLKTASAVIVKKLRVRKAGKPELRLYTKDPCPLCDELKHQLKPFEGRFTMTEIDIEGREGEKYKELYQYEIPVLFLDGIFLCKHRLDVELFGRRLLASEELP